MKTTKIPKEFHKYFWDIDAKKLNYGEKNTYVIERLLEYGDIDALYWLLETFEFKLVCEVVKKSRILSSKSAHFYSYYFHIPTNQILCLQEDFRNKHRTIWNH